MYGETASTVACSGMGVLKVTGKRNELNNFVSPKATLYTPLSDVLTHYSF